MTIDVIAALYIDPRGPYPKMAGVDCWDETRDAKLYEGPWPVVAHPPCGPWGPLRHLSRNQPADCGPRAVEQVRAFGGVLEHPSRSLLFRAFGMPHPGEPPDAWGGRTIEVCQVDWGHVARKRTWLYVCGDVELPPFPAPREPTHWVSGLRTTTGRNIYAKNGSAVPPGIKMCSAVQRRRTPPAFAEWLVLIARSVRA